MRSPYARKERKGFILLLTFMLIVTLTLVVVAFLLLVTKRTVNVGYQLDDMKMLYIAEAGVERAIREIRDDVASTTQTGVADLRGNTTSGTAGASTAERDRVRYFNDPQGDLTLSTPGATGSYVILQDYDLNYLGAAIKRVKIGCRYKRGGGSEADPNLEISYTTNGTFPQAGNSSFDAAVSSASFNSSPFIVLDVTNDRTWTWSIINSPNFQIQARGYNVVNRAVVIDYLFLQVTYEIDTNTEPWYTASYASFPISLNGGTLDSISIADEAGKVHLNYASQTLLRYLMVRVGVADATANTVAMNIVTYRTSEFFDSVEEVQSVTGMTSAIYNAIKDYVTVYPYINSSATRPAGNRAPVNINTASAQVLGAIFDALSLGSGDATRLADDIVSRRASTPFTCFYSSDSNVKSDFYDFVQGKGYLSEQDDPDEVDRVLDNADASLIIPVAGSSAYDAQTTEFSYYTDVFKVAPTASLKGRSFRIQEVVSETASRKLTTYLGDTTSVGWRKENFQ